jgi:hypothetical protein
VASVAGYAVFHKPIVPLVALALARNAASFLAAGIGLAIAAGLGRRLFAEPHREGLVRGVIHVALGLGILALFVLALGVLGLLRAWILAATTLAIGLAVRRESWSWLAELLGGLRDAWPTSGLGKVILGFSSLAVGVGLIEALAPPVHFDALVYHLALPAEFLHEGRLIFTPSNPFWGMPLGASMLYTWAWGLGGLGAATVLGWWVGLFALIGVWGMGRQSSEAAGVGAVAALLAGESIAASLGWAYADWFAALYGLTLVALVERLSESPSPSGAAWAGLAAGFAFGAKLTAAAAVPLGLAAILLTVARRGRRRLAWRYGLGAFAAALPWLIKNIVATGAPFFPFFGSSHAIDAFRQVLYRSAGEAAPVWIRIAAPFVAPFLGVEGAPGFAFSMGPLLLGFLPGLLFLKPDGLRSLRVAAIVVAGGGLAWSVAGGIDGLASQSRLHFWMFPAWAVIAGGGFAGLSSLTHAGIRFSRVAGGLLILSLALSAIAGLQRSVVANPLLPLFGLETTESYRARRLGAYALAMQAVRDLEPPARVLLLWEARGMDCMPSCVPDAWLDRWIVDRRRGGTSQRILAGWKAEGFTHVLLHQAGMEFVRGDANTFYGPQDWTILDATLAGQTQQAEFGDGYVLYRLGP